MYGYPLESTGYFNCSSRVYYHYIATGYPAVPSRYLRSEDRARYPTEAMCHARPRSACFPRG